MKRCEATRPPHASCVRLAMRTPRSPPKGRRARRLAPLLCWAAALVPLVLVVPVFHGRRLALRSRSPPRALTPVDVDKLPPGLLCLPTRSQKERHGSSY